MKAIFKILELSTNNLHFATLPKSPEKDRRKENTKQDSSTNTITVRFFLFLN